MTKIKPFTFLVLSDIHFGTHSDYPDFALPSFPLTKATVDAVPIKANLIETVRNSGVSIDAVLVPGDLTSSATPEEFFGCFEAVKEISLALNVAQSSVYYTFGNHDTNWPIAKLGYDADGNRRDPLFDHVAGSVGSLFVENPTTLVPGPLPGSGEARLERYRILVVNSGYYCTPDQKPGRGQIGPEQFEWLRSALTSKQDLDIWTIVMVHHHPENYAYPSRSQDFSCIQEGAEFLDLIGGSRVDFVCHGHRHHPKIVTINHSGWLAPTTFLGAGSLAVRSQDRQKGEIPNVFHIVTLSGRDANNVAYGEVATYRYTSSDGWLPVIKGATTPMDFRHRFGQPASEAEKLLYAKQAIQLALDSDQAEIVVLPLAESLPVGLRTSSMSELDGYLGRAAEILGVDFIGSYESKNRLALVRRKAI